MVESLRTTQIAFFRFATPCGNSGGAETRYKKYPCKGSCKRKSYETICENIVSRYQTLVSSLPRATTFRHRRPKTEFMTGPHRQPSNYVEHGIGKTQCYEFQWFEDNYSLTINHRDVGLTALTQGSLIPKEHSLYRA